MKKLTISVVIVLLSGCTDQVREEIDNLEWETVNNRRRIKVIEQEIMEEKSKRVYRLVPNLGEFSNPVEPVIIDYKCVNGELYEKYHEDIYLKQDGRCKNLKKTLK